MKIILTILISISLFAQDVIQVGRGSGSYTYVVTTGTNQIVNGDLYLYGNFTKTLSDTGAYSFRPYIVWKYTNGTYDSSAALRIANSFLSRVNAPILDTTGTYYASMLYKTKNGNWIYTRGADSTFTTPVQIVPPATVPVQFPFSDVTNADYSTVYTSNGVALIGLDSAYAYAGGAEFRVGALGSWVTAYTKVYGDDTLFVRLTSSAVCTTAVGVTLTVGGISDVYTVTTKLDNTPNAFTFTDKTGAEVSTQYTSNQITVAGINCNAAISINGGQFQIGTNAWRSASTTIANGSLVRVRITSSANHNASVTSILTIGGVSDTYTVTTRPDTTPSAFTFTDITNAHLDSLHYSNGVALASLDSCYGTAGLDTFKVGALGSWFVGTKKVYGGDTIYLKNVSSGSYTTTENTIFSAGGTTDTYSITTMNDPTFTGNRWYVRPVTAEYGLENGTSWDNAFVGLADIAWASIQPGDILYVSGGSTSATYAETLDPGDWQGSATSRLTIIAGKYSPSPSGHDGTVILNGIHFGGPELGSGNMPSYITVKGFTVTGSNVFLEGDFQWIKGIVIDSCYIHDYGSDFGVKVIKYVDSVIIQNNRIIDCLAGDCAGDRDGIHVNEDAGGIPKNIIIRNNWVRVTSQDPDAHNDAFQAVSGDGFYVYNNVFINDSVNSPQGGGMPSILSAVDGDNNDSPSVLVFNNFMFMNGIWQADANQGWVYELRHDAGTTWAESLPTYIFGNTMVSNGPRNRVFGNGEAYLNLALNNIRASFCPPYNGTDWRTATAHGWMEVFGVGEVYGRKCIIDSVRANLFWRQDSTDGPQVGGQQSMIIGDFNTGSLDYSSDWADWISIGGSGLFRDPKLVTPFGHLSDQGSAVPDILSSSPAIDAGENYTYLVNYLHTTYPVIPQDVLDAILLDFYGNVRGADGDWDIGAVEYAP